jgi:hypothetical protein
MLGLLGKPAILLHGLEAKVRVGCSMRPLRCSSRRELRFRNTSYLISLVEGILF